MHALPATYHPAPPRLSFYKRTQHRLLAACACLLLALLVCAPAVNAQFASFNGTYPTGGVASQTVGSYQFYTYDVVATMANSYLSFTFRNDPSATSLDTISLAVQGSGTNLLQNGGLDTATGSIPTNWVSIGTQGLSAAGAFSSSNPQAGAGAWFDGAVGGFDGIAQSLATTIGSTYTISFYLASSPGFNSSTVQTFAYFGDLPPGLSILGGAALPATHWLGGTDNTWSGANWASDSTGTATTATPTTTDDITFAAIGAANQVNTNLDAAFTINSLTVNSATGISTTGTQTLTVNTTTTLNGLLSVNSGVTLVNGGAFTVASAGGTLAGTGTVQMAVDQSLVMNGVVSVGDPSAAAGASVLSLTTSGNGSVVMGSDSTILVDLWTGAHVGDSTGIPSSSDHLSLTGKLDATNGGTLVLGNPAAMQGFAGGDQWKVVDLNSGAGSITGTLALNDNALHLTSTQVGNFNQSTGVYTVIDVNSGLATAGAEAQTLLNGMQGMLGDINGRLYNLRAGGGEESPADGSITAATDFGVVLGEGDGPEKGPVATKVLKSRQWEVFSTVNYANISLSSIRTQAGVNSQTWAPGVGIERHFSRHLTLGFAASLMETRQTYNGGLGTLNIEGVALSAYASYVRSAFWSDVLYSFGTFDLDSVRNPAGFSAANGHTAAHTNAVQVNGGWNFRSRDGRFVTGPFAGVDYLNVQVNGYSETGGGLAALSYNTRSMDSLVTRVGWSVSQRIETDFAVITPQLRLSYERQNISNNNGTSVNLINQPFSATTTSQNPGQDYMVVGAGANFQFNPLFSMLLTYQGQFQRENMQAHYASVRFSYKF